MHSEFDLPIIVLQQFMLYLCKRNKSQILICYMIGLAGTLYFLLDMLNVKKAAFPAFEL